MRMSQRGLFRWGRQGTCRQQTAANLRTLVHRGVDPASEQARLTGGPHSPLQDLSGGSVHKVDPNGTHLLFPADITLQPDIGFPGDAALQSDLHGLLMLEAIQERTRLEALWSKLQQESPSRSARTFCFRNGLSAVKKEDMRTFVPRLASLLSDSGFQLVTRRDQAVSSALEDHQGVMRGEVAVNEDNYSNLSSFLDAGAKNHLGAVLVWKRGHGIEVKTGLLFFRKLDFMQSELLVSLIAISKRLARQAWQASEAVRQSFLHELTTLEGRRWGKTVIKAGRGTVQLTVEATYNLLVRWGAISKPRISLDEFRAIGNWPPEGPVTAVEQAAIGEAMTTAALQARASIQKHEAHQRAQRHLIDTMLRSALDEDFTNDDRFLFYAKARMEDAGVGGGQTEDDTLAGSDNPIQPACNPLPTGTHLRAKERMREWVSAFLRPVSLKDPVWQETLVLYAPREPEPEALPVGPARWDASSLWRSLRLAVLRRIDPALPGLITHHGYWEREDDAKKEVPGTPYLTSYSSIKVKNLRTLWPVRELRFRPLDNFKIDLALVAALVAVLLRVRLDTLLTQMSALGLCTAWVLGAVFRVTAQRNEYELETTRRLHEKTTARDINVIRMASEDAVQQRMLRCLLVYTALEAHGDCHSADLAHTCDAMLKRLSPQHPPVHLEHVVAAAVKDALRIGLVSQSDEGNNSVLSAVEGGRARQTLRQHCQVLNLGHPIHRQEISERLL